MEKIIVEIFVPALNEAYDVFIPRQVQMFQVLELLKKAVTEMSDGRFVATDETAICYRHSGKIININMTVFELGIRNGAKLMLI